jgi:hypothetical protein
VEWSVGLLTDDERSLLEVTAVFVDGWTIQAAAEVANTRRRLAPLLAGISDPFLHAASQLALASTLSVAGDFDGAWREVTAALEELRGQDEPVFTVIAADMAGWLETALGATMMPCATCARHVTWPTGSAVLVHRRLPGAAGHPGCPAGQAR